MAFEKSNSIYLDHSATTKIHKNVLNAMWPYLEDSFGNPSSVHGYGGAAREAVMEAREKVAFLIGADSEEIVFTSGGTEADNMAILGIAASLGRRGGHIITSRIEHPAVLNAIKFLESKGLRVTFLPVDEFGSIDIEEVKRSITKDTFLISIMHGNNEIGTIEPVSEIGKIARERSIIFHTDAVQTVGKISIDVKDMRCDLLSMSGHKIFGPKGSGALYIRKGVKIAPLLYGGHQEAGRRSGTENVPAIVGFGKACEIAKHGLDGMHRIGALRDLLQNKIETMIPDVRINGHIVNRLLHILSISFHGADGDEIIRELEKKGVAASAGSACTSGSMEISHVISALGVSDDLARGTVRFSLGTDNSADEINYCAEVTKEIVQKLRTAAELESSLRSRRCN